MIPKKLALVLILLAFAPGLLLAPAPAVPAGTAAPAVMDLAPQPASTCTAGGLAFLASSPGQCSQICAEYGCNVSAWDLVTQVCHCGGTIL